MLNANDGYVAWHNYGFKPCKALNQNKQTYVCMSNLLNSRDSVSSLRFQTQIDRKGSHVSGVPILPDIIKENLYIIKINDDLDNALNPITTLRLIANKMERNKRQSINVSAEIICNK